MAKLIWDKTGERYYESGVEQVAVFPQGPSGDYPKGYAWNGITNVSEKPSGAEPTPLYANNSKYLTLMSNEEFGAGIEAYTYPKEFEECDGSAEITEGVSIGQQKRTPFGLAYKTKLGNDVDGIDHGYKLHIIYGCLASPSEKAYATISDDPEAITFTWDVSTTPVAVTGFKPTASVAISSTKVTGEKLKALEDVIYGTAEKEARLPLPDEIADIIGGEVVGN